MKKIALIFCMIAYGNSSCAPDISLRDMYCAGAGLTVGVIAATIGGNYWHEAALKREELAAAQEQIRMKDQQEQNEKIKKEKEEQAKREAIETFMKIKREYSPEIIALTSKKNLDREQHLLIIKSKNSAMLSRLSDYYQKLLSDIHILNRNWVLLSAEDKQAHSDFISKLYQIQYQYNLNLHEDKNAEEQEAKKIKHQEEEERLKLEQERLKVKEQKLRIQVQEGKLEAQKNVQHTKEAVNSINTKIDTLIRSHKNNEQEFAALRILITSSTQVITDAIGAARAHLAALFVQRFDDAKKEVLASQANAPAAAPVVVHQVQPPYNPAAINALANAQAPSEAIDTHAINPIQTHK